MRIEVFQDAAAVAERAVEFIVATARDAIGIRGRFVMAVSGGRTPWQMLRLLAQQDLPWRDVHILQVDERVAPADDPVRNAAHLRDSLLGRAGPVANQIYAMPVEDADVAKAAAEYAQTLARLAGSPAVLDLAHLGLGADGHTASLIPGDAALDVMDTDVALAGPYHGHRRMTLTFPLLDRARVVLWLVTGAEKTAALAQLCAGDRDIPAGRVRRDRATLLVDRAAVGGLTLR